MQHQWFCGDKTPCVCMDSRRERELKIARLQWTMGLANIALSREEAEQAIDVSLARPLPEF